MKNKMNRKLKFSILGAVILVMALAVSVVLVSCGKKNTDNKSKTITVTTSHVADMVKQIGGERLKKAGIKVNVIIPAGEDAHDFEAKVEHKKMLEDAGLILYSGMHFEGGLDSVLEKLKGVPVTKNFEKNTSKVIKTAPHHHHHDENEHPHEHAHEEEHDHEHANEEKVDDPHFWFDVDLYKSATEVVFTELSKFDKDGKKEYEKNYNSYLKELTELKAWIIAEVKKVPVANQRLVTAHEAFNYFARLTGFKTEAPQGLSTESEVGVGDVNETIEYIAKNKVKAIFVESTNDPTKLISIKKEVDKKYAAAGSQEKLKIVGYDIVNKKNISNEQLLTDSLGTSKDNNSYIGMYKYNVNLIIKYLA